MASASRGRVRNMGDSSSSRGGGPIRRVPRAVNSSTSKTSIPYTVNSRSGDSRSLNQHHGDSRSLNQHHGDSRSLNQHHGDSRSLNQHHGDSRSLNQHHGDSSTTRGGHADPVVDTNEYTDDEDDDPAEDTNVYTDDEDDSVFTDTLDRRQLVTRIGEKFATGKVHRAIKTMFTQKHNGVWLTWKEVPRDVVDEVFDIFKTKYRYHPACEYATKEAFENVMKDRYPDIMSEWRSKLKKKAIDAGHFIPPREHNFKVICDYPPNGVDLDRWRKMCKAWDTDKWLQRSQCARKNRMSADSSGAISRHTGGSMGYDEHRIKLKQELGRDPTFKELFFDTHLTKDSKKKFKSGECESMEELVFCTLRSKEAYGSYETAMLKKYGKEMTILICGWVNKEGVAHGYLELALQIHSL